MTPPSATPEAGGRETAPPDVLRGHWLLVARLAWVALAILSVVIFVASVPVGYADILKHSNFVKEWGLSVGFYAAYIVVIGIALALVSWAVAALLFWKCFAHRLALIVSIGLVAHGGIWWEGTFSLKEAYPRWAGVVEVVGILSYICLGIMYYIFPDGRFVPRWTRWAAGAFVAYVLFYPLSIYLLPSDSPFVAYNFHVSIVVAFSISFLLAQIYRFIRVSGPVARQQTKWILLAFTIDAVANIAISLSFFISERDGMMGIDDRELFLFEVIIWPLRDVVWLLIPLSIVVAILRYRLWDIDFIINRTLVYGALTALLAAGYFATIMALQGIGSLVFQVPFRALTGQNSALATVAATLAMAALFNPLRRRLQSFIDRRFYRRKYDARKTLEAFSSQLRNESDLGALSDDLVGVVRETMQPAHVSLWLKRETTQKVSSQSSRLIYPVSK